MLLIRRDQCSRSSWRRLNGSDLGIVGSMAWRNSKCACVLGASQHVACIIAMSGWFVDGVGCWQDLMWEGRSPSCYGPAYPAGLEFIAVFFGCLYAAVIAVPGIVPSITKAFSIRSSCCCSWSCRSAPSLRWNAC
jgi:hypothetical protein